LRQRGRVLAVCGLAAAVVAPSAVLAASADVMRRAGAEAAASPRLVMSYEASQPTGWEQPYNQTIGGHLASKEITYHQKKYRVALLGFGGSGKSSNVVYESLPQDSYVAFKKTLGQAWGHYYAFRYLGGLPRDSKFVVASNSASLAKQSVHFPNGGTTTQLVFGGDLYVVYKPGSSRKHLPINSDLQFIQVVHSTRGVHPHSFVDSARHNPFYGEGAGLTSISGNQIVNFYDHIGFGTPARTLPGQINRAETFLVQDTGRKNSKGKEIVNIYGGAKWGFEFKPVS
jgi:hypothetical protein